MDKQHMKDAMAIVAIWLVVIALSFIVYVMIRMFVQ